MYYMVIYIHIYTYIYIYIMCRGICWVDCLCDMRGICIFLRIFVSVCELVYIIGQLLIRTVLYI